MAAERSSSVILLSVLVLALVLSPILPCQAARAHLDGKHIFLKTKIPSWFSVRWIFCFLTVEGRMLLLLGAQRVPPPPPIRFCPACACCAQWRRQHIIIWVNWPCEFWRFFVLHVCLVETYDEFSLMTLVKYMYHQFDPLKTKFSLRHWFVHRLQQVLAAHVDALMTRKCGVWFHLIAFDVFDIYIFIFTCE